MIGKVIEGRYEGAVVLKLPNKNVLYIETEDSTKVALSKNNVISMADVSDQYPSYGRSVKMVMWNDFVTSIILFGAVPSEQNDSIELPDLLTEKENTTEAVSKKKTKNLLWLLPVVGAIAILSIILLQQFPSAQDSNADVPSVPSEVIQVAEELENTTVSAEALLQVEYQKAEELLTQGDFEAAAIAFEALGEYADSSEKVLECKYLSAEELLSQGDYEIAAAAFEELSEYSDSAEMVLKCKYLHAENLMTSKKYSQAAEI